MSEIKYRAKSGRRGFTAAAAMAVCVAMPAGAASLYKWTDDQGAVHYSDQLPADAMNKGSVVFDKQGRPIKKIDPALTPAQLKAKEAEDERLRATAKAQEDKARRDSALLHSYTSEEEIDFARSRALTAIESQLKSAEEYAGELSHRQLELQKQKEAFAGKALPQKLENELATIDEELARQAKVLAQRKADYAALSAKYDIDKQRYREIKAEYQKANATPPVGAAPAIAPPGPGSKATPTANR